MNVGMIAHALVIKYARTCQVHISVENRFQVYHFCVTSKRASLDLKHDKC